MTVSTESGPQLSPILTLHETTPGQFLLRLHKVTQNSSLVSLLIQQLPGIRQIIVVTPLDTKIFNIPNGHTRATAATAATDEHSLPISSPDEIQEIDDADDSDPMASVIAMAEEARPPDETDSPAPAASRKRRSSASPPNESPCGRCVGIGHIRTLVEGGASAEVLCPVCRGTGQSIKFGMNVKRGK